MPSIDCLGESFEVWPEISAWAFADFAAKMEKDDSEAAGAGAVLATMALLKDCVIPEDWDRFEAHTRAKRASFEDLLAVIKSMTSKQAERPTVRSSDSSDGPLVIDQNSESNSDDSTLTRFRPDQKLAALRSLGVA